MIAIALYASIWTALAMFAAGEAGKRRLAAGEPARWAWPAFALGATLCVFHVLIAVYGWHRGSHAAAVAATARQTAAVYGIAWGGGVYVNYVFAALWLAEVVWWRATPEEYLARPAIVTWTLRSVYMLIIFNAAVVFAPGAERALGVLVVGFLMWLWRSAPARMCADSVPLQNK